MKMWIFNKYLIRMLCHPIKKWKEEKANRETFNRHMEELKKWEAEQKCYNNQLETK